MKKANYFIYVSELQEDGKRVHRPKLQAGYTFTVNGETYGTAKTGDAWTVTELRTGFAIGTAYKRNDAPGIVTDQLQKLIKEKIDAAEIAQSGFLYNAMQEIKMAG